jgi:dimethylhistidine N-methyltransferase
MTANELRALEGQKAIDDVRRGLTARPKTLPPYLFYDAAGSELYERITELPEYYLTRAERRIFATHADAIVAHARGAGPLTVVELGAGSASKTELLLRAAVARRARCLYVPIDVSRTALAAARERLHAELPLVEVRPLATTYDLALPALGDTPSPHLVLFIGSSVGNMADEEASALLDSIRKALPGEAFLVLGTDLRKSPDVLRAAYDDASGVTAAFNLNVLARINRELGGHFDLRRFRHVARWNEGESRVEMHLLSTFAQDVAVDALGLRIHFDAGETIHTESCAKYDVPRVERLLARGGFTRVTSYEDREFGFAVHVAAAKGRGG